MADLSGAVAFSRSSRPEDRDRLRHQFAAGRGGMTPDGARRLTDVSPEHPAVRMVVSALGAPPPDVLEELHARDVVIGALRGRARHAEKQSAAGVQVIIAQGTEAGGHTGDISTLVLVPEVVARVASTSNPRSGRGRRGEATSLPTALRSSN